MEHKVYLITGILSYFTFFPIVEVDERIVQTLKGILRRNIHKIGHLYARFVRSDMSTNVQSF